VSFLPPTVVMLTVRSPPRAAWSLAPLLRAAALRLALV
jgi:hypothetical protein